MNVSNGHPDTPTHVWTTRGYMPRDLVVGSSRRIEDHVSIAVVAEFRARDNGEVVRRDCHLQLKHGIAAGAAPGAFF